MSTNITIINEFSEQYHAALKMIGDVIDKCNDEFWQDYSKGVVISQLVYHVLFSADIFLAKAADEEDSFKGKYGSSPPGPFNNPNITFTKKQLAEYLTEIKEKADRVFKNLTIEEFTSGQLYLFHGSTSVFGALQHNLRHIAHHIGALHGRLHALGNKSIPWVNVVYRDERDTWEEMNDQGVTYIQDGKLDEAEKIYLEICAKSDNPGYLYNFACVYSRKGNQQKALETLETCLKLDKAKIFKEFSKTDSDFSNIRELPAFQQLIGT